MATALKLRADIKKYEAALKSKATPKSLKEKIEKQIEKAKSDLAEMRSKKPTEKKAKKGDLPKQFGAYKGSGVDIKKDSERPAKPVGKRKSKSGKTYYEYRLNRIDIKQPPKKYPKLEDGGMMDKDYSGEYFSIREFVESHDGMDKVVAEKYKIPVEEVDDNLDGELGYDTEIIRNLLKGKGYKVSYDNKNDLIIVKKKMEDGGAIPEGYHQMPDGSIMADSAHMAKGGKTQGYDDKEDERLSMKHGKISGKDFVGSHEMKEHSRRDDARFEERKSYGGELHRMEEAKMAKGGEMKIFDKKEFRDILDESIEPLYVGLNKIESALRYMVVKGQVEMSMNVQKQIGLDQLKKTIEKIEEIASNK